MYVILNASRLTLMMRLSPASEGENGCCDEPLGS